MEKTDFFNFLTVLMPGFMLFGLIYSYYPMIIPDGLSDNLLITGISLIPIGYILGEFVSMLGAASEQLLGRVTNQVHPVVKAFEPYAMYNLESDATLLFKCKFEDDVKEDYKLDHIFSLMKQLIYQQSFGSRSKSISVKATFFRNLVALSWIAWVFITFNWENGQFFNSAWIIVSALLLLILPFLFRTISQRLYRAWFHEVIKDYIAFRSSSK